MTVNAGDATLSHFDQAEDAAELRRRTAALHARMVAGGPYTFLPTAGVFLTTRYDRFKRLASGGVPDDFNDDDAKGMYQVGHEATHIAQVVFSPWLFVHVSNLASIAAATRRLDRLERLGETELAHLAQAAAAEFASLSDERDGFTVLEILEAQAVLQGLRWTAVINDAARWRWAVDKFHDGAALYLRLLHLFADELELGDSLAFELLPRLCALAIQTDDPRSAMAELADRVRNPVEAAAAASLPALEFCHWARVNDPVAMGRSLRERDPELFRGQPWSALLSPYFDRFEQISSIEARLDLLLRSDYDSPHAGIFRPLYAVFADGQMIALKGNAADYEIWTRATLTVLDTLEFLDARRGGV